MKFSEIYITELRQGLLGLAKQTFPTWPDYVVTDWIYKNFKTNMAANQADEQAAMDWITATKQRYGQLQWTLEKLKITLDIFDPETQQRIKSRAGGVSNPQNIPKDDIRHAQQQQMIQTQGISKEPIIVYQSPQGYELIEGYHRTIQNIKEFPEGYEGPAWVGKGPLGRVSAELGGD